MADIKSTLTLEDRISNQITRVQRAMENAAASAENEKQSVLRLENALNQQKITLNQLLNSKNKDTSAIEKARKDYDNLEKELTQTTAAYLKYEKQVMSAENKIASLQTQQNKVVQEHKQTNNVTNKGIALWSGLGAAIGNIATNLAIQGFNDLRNAINGSIDAYRIQEQAESQLAIITKSRMGLNDAEIASLSKLASAQQKIGVVGDEATLAGMAGLAAFARQKSTIEQLTPAMDNLAVKMYGYNVTAEGMNNISRMIGRALLGDIGGLSRMGIKITDVQKKRLMQLNEEQRAIELSKILTGVTGNLNEEMAKTPFGRITQAQNAFSDSMEDLGKILLPIKAAFVSLAAVIAQNIVSALTSFVEKIQNILTNASFMEGLFENLIIIAGALSPIFIKLGIDAAVAGFSMLRTGILAAWAGRQALIAGLKTAGAWLLANAPLLIVIATIGTLMIVFVKFNKVVEQVLNWCIDKFFNFAQVYLSVVRNIAQAIDSVFKTNLTAGVDKLSSAAENARNTAKKGTHEMQKWLEGVGKTDFVANLTAKATKDKSPMSANIINNNKNPLENAMSGGAVKTKEQGEIQIKEEDLEMLNSFATRDFMLRYQTLSPNLTFGNVTVNENADITEVVNQISTSLIDAAQNNLNSGMGK